MSQPRSIPARPRPTVGCQGSVERTGLRPAPWSALCPVGHSNQTLVDLAQLDVRTYIAEPNRGRRRWKHKAAARAAVHANRRRIRGRRGCALQRCRSERLERPNAHLYDTGGMRRTHLRGHDNILKRLLVHTCGFNLGLLMRALVGVGTARGLQGRLAAVMAVFVAFWTLAHALWRDRETPSAATVKPTPPRRPGLTNNLLRRFSRAPSPRPRFALLPVAVCIARFDTGSSQIGGVVTELDGCLSSSHRTRPLREIRHP